MSSDLSCSSLWALVYVACATLGCCADGVLTVAPRPEFIHCSSTPPMARQGYPSSWNDGVKGNIEKCKKFGQALSGFHILNEYDKVGKRNTNEYVFQSIRSHQISWVTDKQCGDTPIYGSERIIEYFKWPANDLLARFACCEERLQAKVDGKVAILDLTHLPNAVRVKLPPMPPGENALILTQLTPQERRELEKVIDECAAIVWSLRYEYDGCNPPPRALTSCGSAHCLRLEWKDARHDKVVLFER